MQSNYNAARSRDEIRDQVKEQIRCTEYLQPAPDHKGDTGYICPACGSGTHNGRRSTGAVKYYPETNTWHCHACGTGGDVIDLYRHQNGTDYSSALADLAAKIGLTLPGSAGTDATEKNDRAAAPQTAEKATRQGPHTLTAEMAEEGAQSATEPQQDFTDYYQYCGCGNLTDPAAIEYITGRGISLQTANNFNIGYDAAADPASAPGATGTERKPHPEPRVIIPCTNHFYIARAIDPAAEYKAPNPKGSNTKPFYNCLQLAAEKPAEVIFIAEGWADALSFIECGAPAVALNGAGNGKLLLEYIDKYQPRTSFIICPDNDSDPDTAERIARQNNELKNDLLQRGYTAIIYNVAGDQHDANDALLADRAKFEESIAEARAAAAREALPGLLTYKEAVNQFATADTRYIEMHNFPEFCKRAKIRKHDSVVIAADTGAGKSSLALNFINDLNDAHPVIYFNLEMDELTILRRLVAIRSGIELDRIEGYQQDEQTAAEVNNTLKALTARKPLQVLKTVYDIKSIEAQIARATAGREDPTIVVIDHSLLVTASGNFSRYERFTFISEELRRISLNYNIILFVLLQQSREGKKDENERPKNYSLKESGSWENDATHIVFLWYDPADRCKKLLMTKNRTGTAGDFYLNYYKHTQTYSEKKDQPADDAAAVTGGEKVKRI